MNGIHEVTGSIPVWSTNLRSLALPQARASVGKPMKVLQSETDPARVLHWPDLSARRTRLRKASFQVTFDFLTRLI